MASSSIAVMEQGTGAADAALFRDIARYAPTMLWVSDARGAMIFLNEQYLRFTGLTAEQARSPTSWKEQVHPDDREHAMRAYVDALADRRAFSVEYRLRRHDGMYRAVLDLAQPRRDSEGGFDGYIGTTFDITERKAQEAALVESNRAVREQSRELNLLYELKSDLQVCREVDETLPVLAKYLGRMFGERALAIRLYNNSRDLVEPFLALGRRTPLAAFSPERCWALRKGKSHFEETTAFGPVCPNAASCGGDGALCLPMTAFGECVGVMQFDLGAGADSVLVDALQRSGQRVADEVAAAIEELKLRARLHHQSVRDPLTQLYNRRYFIESLAREINRAEQGAAEFAVLMLDLDHFKLFNDTHGHQGGDVVLREFGKVLVRTLRGGDVPCRYGGEEFAVLMLDCPPAGAWRRAEEIRAAVAAMAIDHHGTVVQGITTSIGVACFPADAGNVEQLVARADDALYRAKKAGRDRVCGHAGTDAS